MIRRSAVLLPIAALTLTAACTSSSGGGSGDRNVSSPASASAPTSGSSSSSPATSATSAKATPVTQPTSVPASVPNASGVIKNKLVALTSCKASADGWQASGTAKPRSGKNTRYTVTVFFTTNSATVQAFGHTKVTVAKGKTAPWTVTSRFTAAPGTLCVLRGAG